MSDSIEKMVADESDRESNQTISSHYLVNDSIIDSGDLNMKSPPSKKKCPNRLRPDQDFALEEMGQQGPNTMLDVHNFMSKINITVSDYISQQYLVRGSPSYKVLKDKIREYCLSLKPTGMKDDASCSVLFLVYKSLPELKRTDEADSIIRKMLGKHIRNAKYRAKCKLRECKMTDSEKVATMLHRNKALDQGPLDAPLNPSLLAMLQTEAYKVKDPQRKEFVEATLRDFQSNIRASLPGPCTTNLYQPRDPTRPVSYGGHCSLANLSNQSNQQSAFKVSSSVMPNGLVVVKNVMPSSLHTRSSPSFNGQNNGPASDPGDVVQVKNEMYPSNGDINGLSPDSSNLDVEEAGTYPKIVNSNMILTTPSRHITTPSRLITQEPPLNPSALKPVNEICDHRLKFIAGITYACINCNDYFERLPTERLLCQLCKKPFTHRHLLMQHNNEVHASVR